MKKLEQPLEQRRPRGKDSVPTGGRRRRRYARIVTSRAARAVLNQSLLHCKERRHHDRWRGTSLKCWPVMAATFWLCCQRRSPCLHPSNCLRWDKNNKTSLLGYLFWGGWGWGWGWRLRRGTRGSEIPEGGR